MPAIAGLIRAPSILDPRINPAAAQRRFKEVVTAMGAKKWLDPGQVAALKVPPTIPLRTRTAVIIPR